MASSEYFLVDGSSGMNNYEKPFLVSGRNTIIHKQKKVDLVIVNEVGDPVIVATRQGVRLFEEELPVNKQEAKARYLELVNISSGEVFGETKTLLFIQALNNKEYKIDYSKTGTDLFIRIHQENYI